MNHWKKLTRKELDDIGDWRNYDFQVLNETRDEDEFGFFDMYRDSDILNTIRLYLPSTVYRYRKRIK